METVRPHPPPPPTDIARNLLVNSAIWMKYGGLIGDPQEPNSDSLLEHVKGAGGRGPLHCSARSLAVVSMADERLMAI